MPYVVNPGIRNVPVGRPVLLQAPTQASYSWTLTAPSGSSATLDSGTIQNPIFTPDRPGTYTLREGGTDRFTVTAANWVGVIAGVDAANNPVVSDSCVPGCHSAAVVANFTAWRESGHAEISRPT